MTDLPATQKTGDGEGLRIQQRPRRLADRAWLLLAVPGVCCLEATDGWWSGVGNAYRQGRGASAREVR